jgi:hypothetical protein
MRTWAKQQGKLNDLVFAAGAICAGLASAAALAFALFS